MPTNPGKLRTRVGAGGLDVVRVEALLLGDDLLEVLVQPLLRAIGDDLRQPLETTCLDRLVGCGDRRFDGACSLQTCIGSAFAGAVHPYQGLEEVVVGKLPGLAAGLAHVQGPLECGADLRLVRPLNPRQHGIHVAAVQRLAGGRDDGAVERVAVRQCRCTPGQCDRQRHCRRQSIAMAHDDLLPVVDACIDRRTIQEQSRPRAASFLDLQQALNTAHGESAWQLVPPT